MEERISGALNLLAMRTALLIAISLLSHCTETTGSQRILASGASTSSKDSLSGSDAGCATDVDCEESTMCDRGSCVVKAPAERFGVTCPSEEESEVFVQEVCNPEPCPKLDTRTCGAYLCQERHCRSCVSDKQCRSRIGSEACVQRPGHPGWRCGAAPISTP